MVVFVVVVRNVSVNVVLAITILDGCHSRVCSVFFSWLDTLIQFYGIVDHKRFKDSRINVINLKLVSLPPALSTPSHPYASCDAVRG